MSCNSIMGLFDVSAQPKKCECGCVKLRLYQQGCMYSSYVNIIVQLAGGEKRSAVLYGDFLDVRPGSTLKLTGVWRIQEVRKSICRVYFQVLGALQESVRAQFNTDDLAAFQALAAKLRGSDLDSLFVRSIFPGVCGHLLLKQMLLCALLSGTEHAGTRANIHLLVIGDPSTAKSQFLK